MTVELSALPWPAAIVAADGQLHECNARWETRFGSCDDLEREFPEAAQKLREVVEKRAPPGALVRAPGEIAPLHLSYAALNATESLWLMIVEGRAVEVSAPPPLPSAQGTALRDVELAMDGVAMRLQARNWRAFFHDSAVAKALIGLHGETLEVNDALCQLLDRSEHELLHLFARDLRHPEDREMVDEHYRLLREDGPPVAGLEARYRHRNGHHLSCLLALSLIRDSRHKPLYFAAEIEDITSRRLAEAQLRAQAQDLERANSELTRSNADLERFAFVASHDLQEPLRKIRVFGDRLDSLMQQLPGDAPVSADLVRYIHVMTSAAQRMQNLVNGAADAEFGERPAGLRALETTRFAVRAG